MDHNLAKAGPLPTSWNLFYERAQNQVALLSLLYDPAGPLSQKVHYQERSAFLEALLQKHRSNTEAFPLRILMDIWSEVWHDFDSRIKSSLAALFPETLAAGVRDCILRGQQQGQSFNYPDSFNIESGFFARIIMPRQRERYLWNRAHAALNPSGRRAGEFDPSIPGAKPPDASAPPLARI